MPCHEFYMEGVAPLFHFTLLLLLLLLLLIIIILFIIQGVLGSSESRCVACPPFSRTKTDLERVELVGLEHEAEREQTLRQLRRLEVA